MRKQLEKHGNGVLDQSAEGLEPPRADRSIDHPMVAAQLDGQVLRLLEAAVLLLHDAGDGCAHSQNGSLQKHHS